MNVTGKLLKCLSVGLVFIAIGLVLCLQAGLGSFVSFIQTLDIPPQLFGVYLPALNGIYFLIAGVMYMFTGLLDLRYNPLWIAPMFFYTCVTWVGVFTRWRSAFINPSLLYSLVTITLLIDLLQERKKIRLWMKSGKT